MLNTCSKDTLFKEKKSSFVRQHHYSYEEGRYVWGFTAALLQAVAGSLALWQKLRVLHKIKIATHIIRTPDFCITILCIWNDKQSEQEKNARRLLLHIFLGGFEIQCYEKVKMKFRTRKSTLLLNSNEFSISR